MRTLVSCFFIISISLPSLNAQNLLSLKNNINSARDFNYCSWHFQDGSDQTGLESFDEQIKSDDTVEEEKAIAVYVLAGTQIAMNAKNEKSCKKSFKKGRKKFEKKFKSELKNMRKREWKGRSEDPVIKTIQDSLSNLWVRDQAGRIAYSKLVTEDTLGSDYWARRMSVANATYIDAAGTAYMKDLLESYDWIDNIRFGSRIGDHAWILVQHADDHPAFQALALERMEVYLKKGGVKKSNYAYLWDRVAVNHDRKQRYGTQPTWECTETGLVLAPLEDPDSVNERRATMDLGKVEDQLAEMTRSVCR